MPSDFCISVIIPVHNCEKYIRRAADSVLMQKEVGELIIIDDGSLDASLELCLQLKELDKRIIVLQHKGGKNKGASASRNLGIKNATYSFIGFLDADDYYLPNRFRTALNWFKADNSIDGVYENIGVLENGRIGSSFSSIQYVEPECLFENLNPIGGKVWFHANGLTVKKSIFKKSGLFEERLRTSEDTLLWFKMSATAKLVPGNINTPVSISERRLMSLSSDKKLVEKDMNKMLLQLYKWAKWKDMGGEKIELILEKLFLNVFNFTWQNRAQRILKESNALLKVFFISPHYAMFESKAFRRYAGQLVGYNKLYKF
ncbi:MAG: glycosyl transferase family 2 [Segetibacter sp.]|nr:glycosyl transferase family 2 [Segetibacter sp.]